MATFDEFTVTMEPARALQLCVTRPYVVDLRRHGRFDSVNPHNPAMLATHCRTSVGRLCAALSLDRRNAYMYGVPERDVPWVILAVDAYVESSGDETAMAVDQLLGVQMGTLGRALLSNSAEGVRMYMDYHFARMEYHVELRGEALRVGSPASAGRHRGVDVVMPQTMVEVADELRPTTTPTATSIGATVPGDLHVMRRLRFRKREE